MKKNVVLQMILWMLLIVMLLPLAACDKASGTDEPTETVTEAEIRESIRRPVGARDVDGVKRRTRAGMGRCQAGFCTPRTVEILAEELGISPLEVTKFGGDSKILRGYLFEEGNKNA